MLPILWQASWQARLAGPPIVTYMQQLMLQELLIHQGPCGNAKTWDSCTTKYARNGEINWKQIDGKNPHKSIKVVQLECLSFLKNFLIESFVPCMERNSATYSQKLSFVPLPSHICLGRSRLSDQLVWSYSLTGVLLYVSMPIRASFYCLKRIQTSASFHLWWLDEDVLYAYSINSSNRPNENDSAAMPISSPDHSLA